jgi:DNA-binding transcriptional LysR family regulator
MQKRKLGKLPAAEPKAAPLRGPGSGLSLRTLEIFVAVGQTGTMVAAAKRLKLTQPAISQMIGALETNLGVQLFDRSVRPPALTLQGAALVKHASTVIDAAARLQDAVRLGDASPLPSLRIGMLNSFATTMGPHVLHRLRDVAGAWSVDSGFHATRYRSVVERDFDFVITADESTVPDEVELLPILSEPFLLVVPRQYRMHPALLKELNDDCELIRFGRDPNLHSRVDQILLSSGISPRHRYHLDTTEGVLAMVSVGMGWSVLPPLAVFRALERRDNVQVLPFPGRPFYRTINVVCLKGEGSGIGRKIRDASLEALREHFLPRFKEMKPELARLIQLGGQRGKARR